ncbi:hypothetical protein H6785_02385 [Candidatus Nomurabacteria bacterium]|nr:hypothetical protein [Candidatus Kaiserbacteria bacterium]MCB9815397.1 hypothetical protein [Candidatus Nomurabacteria bacterium]
MIPQGLFTQIGMVIVSVAIIITYIQPIFEDIKVVQADTETYISKLGEVSNVNNKLKSLTVQLNSISTDDRTRLRDYMPDEVDTIAVVRDLQIISEEAGVIYINGLSQDSVANNSRRSSNPLPQSDEGPTPYSFQLVVEGTYTQIKDLFKLIEHNNYPLELHGMNITQLDGGFLSADITLVTYAYNDDSLISAIDNQE